jgi:tetratricopeptide (TPR) repeat protein
MSQYAPMRDQLLLADERAFLERSLRDLDDQLASGDMDPETHRVLSDDYTARLAEVLAATEQTSRSDAATMSRDAKRDGSPTTLRKRIATLAVIGCFLAGTAWALWAAIGNRAPGSVATGGAPTANTGVQRAQLQADVQARPNDPKTHLALARYLIAQQEYVDALRSFDAAAALDPADAESRAYGGWITYLAGVPDRALDRVNAAVRANPEYADSYFFRGMILFQGLQRPADAIADFEEYLVRAPQSPLASQVQSVLSRAQQAVSATTVTPSTPTTK